MENDAAANSRLEISDLWLYQPHHIAAGQPPLQMPL
jgi:hypothetical protein